MNGGGLSILLLSPQNLPSTSKERSVTSCNDLYDAPYGACGGVYDNVYEVYGNVFDGTHNDNDIGAYGGDEGAHSCIC